MVGAREIVELIRVERRSVIYWRQCDRSEESVLIILSMGLAT